MRLTVLTAALAVLLLPLAAPLPAYSDPASHRNVGSFLAENPEWFPRTTISPGSVTVVVPEGLLRAARRDSLSPAALLKEFLESDTFCHIASQFPTWRIDRPLSNLYVTMSVTNEQDEPDVAGWADRQGVHLHIRPDSHTHLYQTAPGEQQVIIHDFRPQPAQCPPDATQVPSV